MTVSTVTTTTTATLVASAMSGSRSSGIAKGGVVGAAIGSAIVGGLLGLLAGFLMWRKARHSLGSLYQVQQGGDLHQGGGVGGPYQQQVKAELPQSTALMQELSAGNYRGG
ncbi:hypothetical protein OIDMADRAFT_34196 [Oidiodendron maius Zn]|uniref:Uncharacterized protein n=1 Tax=Oidiodendron maius (strain Zn) TaxID=913774 RepID=A0A0C3GYV2_OIDMZ|nr:hypothetical protein OIDMADRAFT_34196 [Oidiodendron maius Zn]